MRRVLAGLLLGLPAVAAAQSNRETLPPGQVRVMVEKYAQCMARVVPDKIRAALVAEAEGRRPDWPVSSLCINSSAYSTAEMKFQALTYRYAMADALYAADFGRDPVPSFADVPLAPPPALRPLDPAALPADARRADAIRADHDRAAVNRLMLIVGDCVVRTAPAAVHSLLTTAVETKAETAALAAVQPVVAQCIPQDQTVRLSRITLRGVLAVNAYQLSVAAGRSGSASGAPNA